MKKQIEIQEIRSKDEKALFGELQALNKKLAESQFKASFRRLKNFHEITSLRKRIARIWTILGEKTMEKYEKESIK